MTEDEFLQNAEIFSFWIDHGSAEELVAGVAFLRSRLDEEPRLRIEQLKLIDRIEDEILRGLTSQSGSSRVRSSC